MSDRAVVGIEPDIVFTGGVATSGAIDLKAFEERVQQEEERIGLGLKEKKVVGVDLLIKPA